MDHLLENDTREASVQLNETNSINFLEFIYPDWLILSGDETLQNLLDKLVAQGHYKYPRSGKKPGWTGYAPLKGSDHGHRNRETKLARFFNDVRTAVHKVCAISCFKWSVRSATKPLDGAYAVKPGPDITCYFRTLEGGSDWEHVVTFCEVKNRASVQTEKESFLDIAAKASCLLGAQDGRHFIPCIRFLGSSIYLTIFHRTGSISTCPFDINSSPLTFLRILIGVSLSDYLTIGFDTSIKWQRFDPIQKSGTSDDDDDTQMDSGDSPSPEESESTNSQHSQPLRSNLHQEEERPKWLEITDICGKHSKVWLKSILAMSDSLTGPGTMVWGAEMNTKDGRGENVVVKDSWIDPFRKYTEGMILRILNEHGIEGVPTLVSEEQVKTPLWTNSQRPIVNFSTHFLLSALPPDSPFDLRVLSHLVSLPAGRLIIEFASLGELLVAFLDHIVAHKHAFEDAGVLHRDISPSNLFLAHSKGRTDHRVHMDNLPDDIRECLCERIRNLPRRGVLGDWGYANPEARSPASTPSKISPSLRSDISHPGGLSVPPVNAESPREYDNRVPVRRVGSSDAPTLLSVSELTNEYDIVLLTDPNGDPRRTIDLCPLSRTGTRPWMSAELVMAGPEQPVIHSPLHDLESFFYVLVGICLLYKGPFKQKSEKKLTEGYDKVFSTFEPTLKTITIQSNLTWNGFVLRHIHSYFKPLIPLLTKLRSEIILPLATNDHGEFFRESSCDHDTFIKHVIATLSELRPEDWESLSPKSDNTSRMSSSEVTSTSGPPVAAPLLAPSSVPDTIRSDAGLYQPSDRSLKRARDSDSPPSSPLKRPRLLAGPS